MELGDWHPPPPFATIASMSRRLFFVALTCLIIGCGRDPTKPSAPEPLRIAAASDLQTVMPTLIERFRATHKIEVVATFGSSGQLSQQIRQGAPFDVFLAANRKYVVDLASDKAIDPLTVRDYAIGSLVLVVREELADKVKTMADLRDVSVKKIAIANPETAPYGTAAKQALINSGLWNELEPKRVQAETVRQALQFVQTGNAEAALVGSAIAKVEGVRAFPVDQKRYAPLWQAVGVTTVSTQPAAARLFAQFILGNDGQKILKAAGFLPPIDTPK